MEVMPARGRRKSIDPRKYARLIAASLPIPPRTEADNDRFIELLSRLDEREDLTSEEDFRRVAGDRHRRS
jgi:hypothetical protein